MSLDAALESMYSQFDPTGNPLSAYSIHYIQGTSVTSEGNAIHWIIGIKKGNSKLIFNYDSESQSIDPWPAWLPVESIDLDKIMMPECFFLKEQKIQNLFQNSETIYSLELIGTTYRVNVQTGTDIRTEMYSATRTGSCPEPTKRSEMTYSK